VHNPFTEEHLNCCNRVLNQTPQYIELAKACVDCGWDWAQQYLDRLQEQQRQATLIKAKAFPNRP